MINTTSTLPLSSLLSHRNLLFVVTAIKSGNHHCRS
jgi:hypothetical protein